MHVSNCKTRCQLDIIELHSKVTDPSCVQFLSDGKATTKLAISVFLYCGEFVKKLY